MRIASKAPIPHYTANYTKRIHSFLVKMWGSLSKNINLLSEGRISAHYNSLTSTPTVTDYANGDKIYNSNIIELGSVGNKYVLIGWIFNGTAWLEMRTPTGN